MYCDCWNSSARRWLCCGESLLVGPLKSGLICCMLTLLLTSCGGLGPMAPAVPYPVLDSATVNDRGGICLDKADTERLLRFIDALRDKQ